MCVKKPVEMTIEELQARWKSLGESGIVRLRVIESFKKYGERTFEVYNLTMDIDQDIVICYDKFGVLLSNYSGMCAFLKQYLTSITIVPYKVEILKFGGYGTVIIEASN